VKGRYADVVAETISAEEAVREQRRQERSYRRMLSRTDDLLGELEGRNLAGQRELDDPMRQRIALTLLDLTPRARNRFPPARTVQQALDGVFEVQETILVTLQRMLHWDRLLAMPWEAQVAGGDEPWARRSA
jgi:hypothetical protein